MVALLRSVHRRGPSPTGAISRPCTPDRTGAHLERTYDHISARGDRPGNRRGRTPRVCSLVEPRRPPDPYEHSREHIIAVTDIKEYAHLSAEDVAAIGSELDRIRTDITTSLGESDARYIHNTILAQRALEAGGRILLLAGNRRPMWVGGTIALALAKIIENMELGHNTMHGQWDWMNDPEVHSTTWEWDMVCPSKAWQHTHNFQHHKFTNVLGMDDDLGYSVLRVTSDQEWEPKHLHQLLTNAILTLFFQWGIALQDVKHKEYRRGEIEWREVRPQLVRLGRKIVPQILKDYVVFPALSGRHFRRTMLANATANLIRNIWTHDVIFCGHFPDGVSQFTIEEYEKETPHEWYLRQMLGSANLDGGKVTHFMTGNLSYQIEHHLFPDLPSNRYPEIAARVRPLFDRYGLPYVSGPMWRQYGQVLRTLARLSLPDEVYTAPRGRKLATLVRRYRDGLRSRRTV